MGDVLQGRQLLSGGADGALRRRESASGKRMLRGESSSAIVFPDSATAPNPAAAARKRRRSIYSDFGVISDDFGESIFNFTALPSTFPSPTSGGLTEKRGKSYNEIFAYPVGSPMRTRECLEEKTEFQEANGSQWRQAFLSSTRTCRAISLRVSNTPWPSLAIDSKTGSWPRLNCRFISSTESTLGRSRLFSCSA